MFVTCEKILKNCFIIQENANETARLIFATKTTISFIFLHILTVQMVPYRPLKLFSQTKQSIYVDQNINVE